MPSSAALRGPSSSCRRRRLVYYLPLSVILLQLLLAPIFITWKTSRSATTPLHDYNQVLSTQSSSHDREPIVRSHQLPTSRLSLSQLTGAASPYSCPDDLVYIDDTVVLQRPQQTQHDYASNTTATSYSSHGNKIDRSNSRYDRYTAIPKMIHQTSKSRCVTPDFAQAIQQWQSFAAAAGYNHYFHDDVAVMQLFDQVADKFSSMRELVRYCLLHGTARADLWRYLVLYEYGGIYVDLDAVPTKELVPAMFQNNSGVFVIEQYHLLSQYFMAAAPRHPLLWYAIQVALQTLATVPDTGAAPAAMVTGPHALHKAFMEFCKDAGHVISKAGAGQRPVHAGIYAGTWNYSIVAYGNASDQNKYINRDVLGGLAKKQSYQKMTMRHFSDDKQHPSGQSCLSAILHSNGILPPHPSL